MYEVYKLNEDLYQIHSAFSNEVAMEGTLLAILTYAVYTLGFNANEMEFALLDILKNEEKGHNAAHFGMNKTFLYSFDKSSRRPKVRKTG